ncbi:MAG: hypothetical protein IT440_11055 [Phycisphaeraceae bacterium]|nr:hypothetical protein [Phycisphaeraceae bacterium]
MTSEMVPDIHLHTDDDGYVLLVKCLNRDGTAHGGFIWPKSGLVDPGVCSREPTCESGGLFGWPWGLFMGDGRNVDPIAEWRVFRARPENVIAIGDKAKAVRGADGLLPEVIYSGDMGGAMTITSLGRAAWIKAKSSDAASATGDNGAASATGDNGAASATGERGAASATGWSGVASATGDRGAASATGEWGAASATSWRGVAGATGERVTIEVGPSGLASATCDELFWTFRVGAVLIQRWKDGDTYPFIVFDGRNMPDHKDGDTLYIVKGKVMP